MSVQSNNVRSTIQLTEVVEQAINDIRSITTAIVTDVANGLVTLTGDFSSFVFSCNPANNLDKYLLVTFGGNTQEFQKCKLTESGTVTIPRNRSFPLVVNDEVEVLEQSPFYFEGTQTSIGLLNQAQPAIVLLNPASKNTTFSNSAMALTDRYSVQIMFTDFSEDYRRGNGSFVGTVKGYNNDYYVQYIQKPLAVYVSRLLKKLNHYIYTNGAIKVTVTLEDESFKEQFMEFMGTQHSPAFNAITANVSGWVVNLNLTLHNAACIV